MAVDRITVTEIMALIDWPREGLNVILDKYFRADGWDISSECALSWLSLLRTDDSTLAWCRQATSDNLS